MTAIDTALLARARHLRQQSKRTLVEELEALTGTEPRLLVRSQLDAGTLQAALTEYSPDDLWLYAAYTQRRHNSAALKALLAFLEERWKED